MASMQPNGAPRCVCACRSVAMSDAVVRPHDVVLFDKRHPCVVRAVRRSVAGKHAWSKLELAGTDLITGQERVTLVRQSECVCFPPVATTQYAVTGVSQSQDVVTLCLAGHAGGTHKLDVPRTATQDKLQEVLDMLAGGAQCAVGVMRITWCDHAVMPGASPDDRERFVECIHEVRS